MKRTADHRPYHGPLARGRALTDEEVLAIRWAPPKIGLHSWAKAFGVSHIAVRKARMGETYKHLRVRA